MINIEILENGNEIRKKFIEKFTATWEEFQVLHKDWIDDCAQRNEVFEYDELYLWDKMQHQTIYFGKALEYLRSIKGNVLFMSENENKPYCQGIKLHGTEYKGVVAKANASELADLIEFEWYHGFKLQAKNMYQANAMLPDDIYVFDEAMEHLIVFTHENDYWELEDDEPMIAAESRFCMMYGFTLPDDVSYEKIKKLFELELEQNSSLEVELSFSCSKQFYKFVVSKWTNENGIGYQYWFNIDPNSDYATFEEMEEAKIFNGKSLKEASMLPGVRFDIISINGVKYRQ